MTGTGELKPKPDWEVVQDKLSAFQSLIRQRSAEWTLHSWNIFWVTEGRGRMSTWQEPYVASVWNRRAQ